jgi:hypothetical protein
MKECTEKWERKTESPEKMNKYGNHRKKIKKERKNKGWRNAHSVVDQDPAPTFVIKKIGTVYALSYLKVVKCSPIYVTFFTWTSWSKKYLRM